MRVFQYHPEIAARFPAFVGGVILGKGVGNAVTPSLLLELYQAEQRAVISRTDEGSLSKIEALGAWRSAFRRFGVEPTKYRCAAESLTRRLIKKGDIPSINTLVDIGNLISIRYVLPIAVFDGNAARGTITVRFADGTERFTTIGQGESDPIPAGEVVFTDEANTVMARRWCWRQSAESAASLNSRDILVTIESQHIGGRHDVESAVNDMLALLREYGGGEYTFAILDANQLWFEV